MTAFKRFWSNYSTNIVRFWTNQIVMSLLGISVGLATIAFDNFILAVIGCVFTIGILCFMQYDNMFQLGEKHHFMHADVVRPSKFLGFEVAAFASVPLLLVVIIGFLFEVVLEHEGYVACNLIYYALHGSYIQTHALILSIPSADTADVIVGVLRWCSLALYTLPAILFSALGYYLGSKDKTIRSLLGIKASSKHH